MGAAEPRVNVPSGPADSGAEDTLSDRQKARDLGNQAAQLSRSISDLLNDAIDALERTEGQLALARAALRMCAAELAGMRTLRGMYADRPSAEAVDDVVEEMLEKARGFPPADQENGGTT